MCGSFVQVEPMSGYKGHLYTRTVVGWPGCKHIANNDYSEVIADALKMDVRGLDMQSCPCIVFFLLPCSVLGRTQSLTRCLAHLGF